MEVLEWLLHSASILPREMYGNETKSLVTERKLTQPLEPGLHCLEPQ
jgi:hypothetical protein